MILTNGCHRSNKCGLFCDRQCSIVITQFSQKRAQSRLAKAIAAVLFQAFYYDEPEFGVVSLHTYILRELELYQFILPHKADSHAVTSYRGHALVTKLAAMALGFSTRKFLQCICVSRNDMLLLPMLLSLANHPTLVRSWARKDHSSARPFANPSCRPCLPHDLCSVRVSLERVDSDVPLSSFWLAH